jgi:hypothetical protein
MELLRTDKAEFGRVIEQQYQRKTGYNKIGTKKQLSPKYRQ